MIRYTDEYIEQLLTKFMNGESSLEEEAQLGDYFRTQKVRPEWEEYRMMFAYFDSGMTETQRKPETRRRTLHRIAAAACVAVICGVAAVFLRGNGEAQQTAPAEKRAVATVRTKPAQTVTEPPKTVTAKTEKPVKRRKKPSKTRISTTMQPDKDIEQAKEELRRTQQEIEETYREIAEALNETAVIDLEMQAALTETMMISDGQLYESPQAGNGRTLIIH